MKVREIMTSPVITVREDTPLEEVAEIMLKHKIGGVPVVGERGEVVGIVTETDFTVRERGFPFSTFRAPQVFGQWLPKEGVERIYDAARSTTAKEIMTRRVKTITEDESVEEVLELMLRHDVNRIPVIKPGKVPVGIVARHDLLRMMSDSLRQVRSAGRV